MWGIYEGDVVVWAYLSTMHVCGSRAVLPSRILVSMFSIIVNSFAIWKDPSPSLNHHFIIQPTTWNAPNWPQIDPSHPHRCNSGFGLWVAIQTFYSWRSEGWGGFALGVGWWIRWSLVVGCDEIFDSMQVLPGPGTYNTRKDSDWITLYLGLIEMESRKFTPVQSVGVIYDGDESLNTTFFRVVCVFARFLSLFSLTNKFELTPTQAWILSKLKCSLLAIKPWEVYLSEKYLLSFHLGSSTFFAQDAQHLLWRFRLNLRPLQLSIGIVSIGCKVPLARVKSWIILLRTISSRIPFLSGVFQIWRLSSHSGKKWLQQWWYHEILHSWITRMGVFAAAMTRTGKERCGLERIVQVRDVTRNSPPCREIYGWS